MQGENGRELSRRSQVGLRLSAALACLLVLVGSGLAWATYKQFSASIPHGDAVPALAAGQHDIDGAGQNILLLGNDSRAGATPEELKALSTTEDGGSVNTDTMMVLHVPADGSKATVISFPRDSWLDIPDNGKGKLNSAYGDGWSATKSKGGSETAAESAGIRMVIRSITALTGLHIDHYVQINLLGFYRISVALGGISVCLNAAQNASTDADEFGSGYSGIDLPKGVSIIEGKQALAFVRQRHGLPNGDLDRIRRQQYFLSAAFKKVATSGVLLNPFKLHALLTAVSSSLLTDPGLNLVSLANEFSEMSTGNITFSTIPNDGPQVIYPDGVETSVVQIDTTEMPGFIDTLLGKPADATLGSTKAAAASSVTLDVLNGTSVSGLAGRNASVLKAAGFHVDTVDSTDSTTATTVRYPEGGQAAAKAVAAAVPGAQLVKTASVQRVTLVLGGNGVQAAGLSPATTAAAPAASTAPAAPAAVPGCID